VFDRYHVAARQLAFLAFTAFIRLYSTA